MSNPPITYFTCTLGEASSHKDQTISQSKTISDFLKSQARLYPEYPAVGFPRPSAGQWNYDVFSFESVYKGAVLAAKEFSLMPKGGGENSTCVALLCPSSVDFLFAWLGLMELGYSVLLIAPQCQPAAIASLCKSCSASIIYHDSSYHQLATCAISQEKAIISAQLFPWQSRSESIITLIQTTNSVDVDFKSLHEVAEKGIAYIHHSSGTSTGVPKPIPQTHRAGMGVLPRLDGREKATFTTTPLYHGGIADCFRAWTSKALIWLFPGGDQPITPKNIISCLSAASRAESDIKTPSVKYFSSVPYVLQMLAEETSGLSLLQAMDLVGVGGAALSPKIGDDLVAEGVNLVSRFGSAECGFLLSSHRDYSKDKEWQYLRLSSSCTNLRLEKMDSGQELRELIVKSGWPHMAKTNRPDGSYATSDLFEPHPRIKNALRYHSRNDSQITLLTGKKFDPAPLEDAICSGSKFIKDVVIFGNERQYPGALIFSSSDTVATFNDIWEAISRANEHSEAHSRIGRNMIVLVAADEAPPEKSSKGTVLRGPTEQIFAKEIEQLYLVSQHLPSSEASMEDSEIISVVRSIVHRVLGSNLSDQEDFYQHGVDSIKSTQIRSDIQIATRFELPRNVVYDRGNIQELSNFIIKAQKGQVMAKSIGTQEMLELLEKYSTFDPPRKSNGQSFSHSKVVFLTGATGALGANIIDVLRKDPSVSEIICPVRAKDEQEARARVEASLTARGVSMSDAEHRKIKSMPFNLGKADLGLSKDVLGQIRNQVTSFIHAAWAVNFFLPLHSFVREHIAGLHHLLNLAISCERFPIFTFCSSTASVIRSASPIQEKVSASPEDADSLGYSKSKWVAEAICASVSKIAGMEGRIKIVRVGQLTGDTKNGIWNMSEAWPLMLSTVRELKCLPKIEQELDWLPFDIAAKAVVDISLADTEPRDLVYHVLNSRGKSSWNDLLRWAQEFEAEKFEAVEPSVWLKKLEATKDHPAKRLLWLWEEALQTLEGGKVKRVAFSVENGAKVSEALKYFQGVDKELVRKIWLWIEEKTAQGKIF